MLEAIEASGLATIQDLGRKGWGKIGVPLSGPMDTFAFHAANLLVRNLPDVAAIEIGGGHIELCANQDCVIAAAGAVYPYLFTPGNFRFGITVSRAEDGRSALGKTALACGLYNGCRRF